MKLTMKNFIDEMTMFKLAYPDATLEDYFILYYTSEDAAKMLSILGDYWD